MRYVEQIQGCTGTMTCPRPLTSIEYHTVDCVAWRKVSDDYDRINWRRHVQSYTMPSEQDIEDITNTALTHPRCRVTVETWEMR